MKKLLLWLLNRLQERRTYIGLAWLLTVGGISLRPDLWDQITLVGMALAGLLEVMFKEPRYAPPPADPVEPDRLPEPVLPPRRQPGSCADDAGFNDR